MKIILLAWIFVLDIASVYADEMPFYFFRFEPNQYPELFKSNAEAQKELCKITEKNCTLESAEEFPKYAILPLYEKPDLKSNVVGAFVNAQSKGQTSLGHFKESALASFVINKSGIKKGIEHYVSYNSEWVKTWLENGDFTGVIAFDVGELHAKGFFAYVRADKAIPNTPESYVVRVDDSFDPKEKFDERWYGLANPDESGGVLWLRYKSDLRTAKYIGVDLNVDSDTDLMKKLKNDLGFTTKNEVSRLRLCRMPNSRTATFVYAPYLPDFKTSISKLNSLKAAEIEKLIKGKNDPCLQKGSKTSRYEYEVELDLIYKNGFFVQGVGFGGIERKDLVERQKVRSLFMEYLVFAPEEKSKSAEKSEVKFEPTIFLKKPSMIQD